MASQTDNLQRISDCDESELYAELKKIPHLMYLISIPRKYHHLTSDGHHSDIMSCFLIQLLMESAGGIISQYLPRQLYKSEQPCIKQWDY